MNIRFNCLMILLVLINSYQINNMNFRKCENCGYFIDYTKNNKYNSIANEELRKCKKFYKKNLLTDEIFFENALKCRQDENLCGERGEFFEEISNEITITSNNSQILNNF